MFPNLRLIDRRSLLINLVATLLPASAHAQKPSAPPRIGWLSAGSEPDPFLEAFREGLRKLGYVEGQNLQLDVRHAHGNLETLLGAAAELAQARVALIVASLTAVRAARTIKDIPVLYVISGDPIEAGLAQSLPRPGRNLTGSTFLSLEIAGKRVELLKEALPRLRSLAALSNTDHPGEKSELHATEAAAQRLGIKLIYVAFSQSPFGTSPELDKALETVGRARPDAMIVFPEGATMANRVSLANFATAHRLPSMFGWAEYVAAGGLMSYGASQRDAHARLAGYADKILKGAKPGDLPVEQPTKFELVINLKTARALSLPIPQLLLLRADQVIE
ncbi:MAG: ABC transporter substrate-binding protein [Candidatus Rokuibacteriota bacterium]|nr:MAG: ABC transporter substrate-binding protein [Candidatus Rokubacteria bacterium]